MNSNRQLTAQSIISRVLMFLIAWSVSGCTESNDVEPATELLVDDSYSLSSVAQDLMQSLAGYQSDRFIPLVDELTASVIDGLEGESLESNELAIVDAQTQMMITSPVRRVRYACAGGGTVVTEIGSVTMVNANIVRSRRLDGFVFDQCNHNASGMTLPDDNYTINGSLNLIESRFSASGYSSIGYSHTWTDFILESASTVSYAVEGVVTTSTIRSSTGDSSSRSSETNLYREKQAGEIIISIEDGVFVMTRSSNAGGSIQNYAVDIDGTISGLNTNGHSVAITTNPVLSRQLGVGPSIESNIPFSGQVEFLSDDGSFLYLTGNPTAVSGSGEFDVVPDFLTLNIVDLQYTSVSGEQIDNTGVALLPFTVIAPNCELARHETTYRIECVEE